MGSGKGNSGSMGSSKSLPGYRRNRVPFSCAIRGSFLHACRLRGTILAGRYRRGCERNPAAERRHDGRSEAGSCRCRSLHREGSMPITASQFQPSFILPDSGDFRKNIPSWPNARIWRFHYLVPDGDCFPGSPATKTGPRLLSCDQSFPALAREPGPIGTVPDQHRKPCRHE